MKKIVEKIKTKKKLFIGIIIGGIVVSLVGVVGTIAANTIASNYVLYSNSVTSKTNVKDAIDELYTMANNHCPDGYSCTQTPTMAYGTVVPATGNDTYLAVVYLDPTNLSRECNVFNSSRKSGTRGGCMIWYAYKDNGDSYNLILGHDIATISTDDIYVQSNFNTYTRSWVKELNPRLIEANEIWELTKGTNGVSSWDSSTATAGFYFERIDNSGDTRYQWLFNYITDDHNLFSAWAHLVSIPNNADDLVWILESNNEIKQITFSSRYYYTLRPVITISKS